MYKQIASIYRKLNFLILTLVMFYQNYDKDEWKRKRTWSGPIVEYIYSSCSGMDVVFDCVKKELFRGCSGNDDDFSGVIRASPIFSAEQNLSNDSR